MPIEARRVGEYPQLVFIKLHLAGNNLQHHLAACYVGHAPVDRRGPRVYRYDVHRFQSFDGFVDSGEVAQNPGNQLQVGHARGLLCRVIGFVLSVIGKVEEPGRQSGFVQSFGYKLFLLYGQSHIAIFGCKFHAGLLPARYIGALFVSAGNNHILAVQVAAAPFDGTGYDFGTVFYREGNSRARP